MKKKQIIYIIGTGRSGTTLLEILIGNGEGIFSCGELNRYPRRRGIPPQQEPSSPVMQFWQDIGKDLQLDIATMEKQEDCHYRFEYHTGLVKKLVSAGSMRGLTEYRSFLQKLYERIFSRIQETIITDSSKYPGRALHLSECLSDRYDISYIYIKRDPVQVVRSFAKKDIEQPSKPFLPANLYYFSINLLCTLVVRKLKKRHRVAEVRYEDLVNNPVTLLGQIEADLGLDLKKAIKKIEAKQPLSIGCLFDGNRIRLQGNLQLRTGSKNHKMNIKDNVTRVLNYCFYR